MKDKVKYDCFANRLNKYEYSKSLKSVGCVVLTEMICAERECPFYKKVEGKASDKK